MKTTGNLGSEKMPIIIDQPDTDSNSGSQGNFNILDLVHKPSEFSIPERNFSESIHLEDIVTESEHKTLEGDNKKDWSLKYVPDLFQSDKINSFTCIGFKDKENDVKKEGKKTKKKINKAVNSVDSFQNGDVNSEEVFVMKQLKQSGVKVTKCSTGSKEKRNRIKKSYKSTVPYPVVEEQKIIAQSPVQKLVSPQTNPILIVKIDEQRFSEEKTRVTEYLNYEKSIQDSKYSLAHDLQTQQKNLEFKNKKNFMTRSKCHKCFNCPFMTLSKDYLNFHLQKKQKCYTNTEVFHCPGCRNVFYSLTPLRVHLIHDHKMITKELKTFMQNIQEVRFDSERDRTSYVFESNPIPVISENVFNTNVEMSLNHACNRGEMEKSFSEISDRQLPESTRVLEPCGSSKRPTMLETYLDDINNKGNCNLPPSLNHNGSTLLENTFNFTAPVSEQLPSIQPPPAHSSSNSILDQSHLMVEHQNHNFIGMANVFGTREQSSFKGNDSSNYEEEANMILPNGNYISSHIQDIPVINLEENNLEKSSTGNMLANEINIEDFSTYQENGPASLETEGNDCQMTVEDEDQEEKKKLRKLGVGFRCDINGCKVRLQSEKNIQYHRRCHEGTLYNCPECCKDCSTWVSLSSHLWQAHKIDMELYKCDQCSYKTPSYSRLTNIHRGIHGKARPFLCDICGKGFKTVKQMRNHKNIHKAKMVRMSTCHCEICGRTVADKRQLELHINNTHKKKKPYLCYMCGYASAVKHSLVVHMRRHTGEKPYECEKCEYKTADHNALRRHKMKHSGVRSYKCNHCSYTCIQASTYKVHIKTKHPGLETDVIFSCGQCNFQTLNRGSFLSHTSEHDNFCEQIGKPSRQQNSTQDGATDNDYYGESNRIDLGGPIISERAVETIVDLSGAQTLLEQDDYYDVERITGDLDETQELKFKTSGIT